MTEPPRRRLGASYADEVGPEHVGRRATIRHLLDEDGHQRPTDVVGYVRSWADDGTVVVERRDGSLATLDAATIVASRLLPDPPPRRRRPPPVRPPE